MKRTACIMLALIAMFSMISCAVQADGEKNGAMLPNPMVEVENAAAFEKLKLYIDAPVDATDAKYFIISDLIAQVSFKLDGKEYVYRAAHSEEDISGIYATFDDEEQGVEIDGEDWYASLRTRTVAGGAQGTLTTWAYDTAHFSLYNGGSADTKAVNDLAGRLAHVQFPHYMKID